MTGFKWALRLATVLGTIGAFTVLFSSLVFASDSVLVLEDFENITDASQLNTSKGANYWDFRISTEPTEMTLITGHEGQGTALQIKTTVDPLGVKWVHLWFDPLLDISAHRKLTLWYNISHGVADLSRQHPFQVRLYDPNGKRVEARLRQEFPKDDSWLEPNQWHKLVVYLYPDEQAEDYPPDVLVSTNSRIDDSLDRQGVARFIIRVENAFVVEPLFIRIDDIRLEQ